MAQKIKVQDGIVVYSTPDPLATDIAFDIKGALDVTKQVTVGDDPLASGQIHTPLNSSADLIISTNTDGFNPGGDISLAPAAGGRILLNNITWPTSVPNPGQFIGTTSLGNLGFLNYLLTIVGSDSLTNSQLNILFPLALPGQNVAGPTVMYTCISTGQWRASTGALGYTPVNIAGDTMTGLLILSADPVDPLGAVTKQYADNIAAGVNIHAACETATVAPLPTSIYNNGASGVGATLTASVPGALGTVGGYSGLIVTSRILVKDQVTTFQNGIYVVTQLGNGLNPWILTRATDFDGSPANEISAGDLTYVQEGTLLGTQWVQTAIGTGMPGDYIIIGSDSIVFTQFSGPVPGQAMTINTQVSDYTLQLTDAYNTLIRITKATPAVVTIPNDSTTNMPIGSAVLISWNGAGSVSVAGAVGVTVISPDSLTIGKQYGKITAMKTAANYWEIEGNLAP